MLIKKNSRYKPLYRKFLLYNKNIQNKSKFLANPRKLNKKKWDFFLFHVSNQQKFYRKYKTYDQALFKLPKFANKFNSIKNQFKKSLHASKRFGLFYGGLTKKFIKRKIKFILKQQTISNIKKNSNIMILIYFESRLDTVLYRSHFSLSIKNAQQLIKHGHVLVNNNIITNYSHTLKKGDFIQLKPSSYILFKNILKHKRFWPIPPKYLHINYKTMQIIFGDIQHFKFNNGIPLWLDLHLVKHHYLFIIPQ